MSLGQYYVYIIECEDNTLYTGIAKDAQKRISVHQSKGKGGAKYTRTHQAKTIRALWVADDRSSALKLEYRIKRLRREQKLALIEDNSALYRLIPNIEGQSYRRVDIETDENE